MDILALKFAATQDMKVKEEIERLAKNMASSKSRGGSWRSERRGSRSAISQF
jgi:hypothetical protein